MATYYPMQLALVACNISRANLKAAQLSNKHIEALLTIALRMNERCVYIFKNGNVYYMGRNTAYRLMRDMGYTWNSTTNLWEKG